MKPEYNADGVIINTAYLSANELVGKKAVCPGCGNKIFKSWPIGWGTHAACACKGLIGETAEKRKIEFRGLYCLLFKKYISNSRQIYRCFLKNVLAKMEYLPKRSIIKKTFLSDHKSNIESRINSMPIDEFRGSIWPALFVYIERHKIANLLQFEADIQRVIDISAPSKISEVIRMLKSKKPREDRYWVSGIFEIYVKSQMIKDNTIDGIEFDYELYNGRNIDIKSRIKNIIVCIECSVITESNEDRDIWDRYISAKKKTSHKILIRPGEFDPINAKGPSPYYDAFRFYCKIYDKLAKNFNQDKCQLCYDFPNVLCISISSPRAHLDSDSLGLEWVIDELFSSTRRPRKMTKGIDFTDVSLENFLFVSGRKLIDNNIIEESSYESWKNAMSELPYLISGVLIFDGCKFARSFVNKSARSKQKIDLNKIAIIENVFRKCHECYQN